jgi:uncharacterized DUF497 family protein
MIEFEWDEANRQHLARHGVSPPEAEDAVSGAVHSAIELGREFRAGEQRIAVLGESREAKILIVVFTAREDKLRIVTRWNAPEVLRRHWRIINKARNRDG